MRRPLVLAALASCFFSSATARAAGSRVAVIVEGTATAESEEFVQAVESQLAALPSVHLVADSSIAATLAIPVVTPAPDALARKEAADTLLEAAHQHSIGGDYDLAIAMADQAAQVPGLSAPERALEHEIRAIALTRKHEIESAKREAVAALVLSHGGAADIAAYPPSARVVFGEALASLRQVKLTLAPMRPAGAVATVDDLPIVGNSVSLPAGRHHLRVSARCWRTVERDVTVDVDSALPAISHR